MAIRDTLLANLEVALSSSNVTTSSELPFTAAGVPLYTKNMKKLYVDYDRTAFTEMFNTLNPSNDVPQREITVNAYFTVDAKNLPTDIDTVVSTVLNSRLSVSNCHVRDCSLTNLIAEDHLTYTFEFRFLTI
jgi:hypothetical protein